MNIKYRCRVVLLIIKEDWQFILLGVVWVSSVLGIGLILNEFFN